MSRPKKLSTIIDELDRELEYNHTEMANEIGALPARYTRLTLRPHLASVTEEKALRDLHRLHCVEPYQPEEKDPDPCPPAPDASTTSPTPNTAEAPTQRNASPTSAAPTKSER